MTVDNHSLEKQVCLFFFVEDRFMIHSCPLNAAESYGVFLNYPHSHDRIWHKYYKSKYNVDFDYYPRGRVVYRKTDDTYLIYYDKCMEQFIGSITEKYTGCKIELDYDEHYQCHTCKEDYVT